MKWLDNRSEKGIINPWEVVSCNNVFAKDDKGHSVSISKKNSQRLPFGTEDYVKAINGQNPNSEITFDSLPEPYSGNPDAVVYCLNMNPGIPDPNFDTTPISDNLYTQGSLENLRHNVSDPFWTEGLVKDSQGNIINDNNLFQQLLNDKKASNEYVIHEGARWQREKTKELREGLNGRNPNIFFLEYFPYHSSHGFDFPDYLPSYEYRNALLEFAMNEEKIIIIMRKEKLWYGISDNNIGCRLMRYKKKLFIKYSQGGWLTRKNMTQAIPDSRCDSLTWNDIISVL